MRAMKLVGKDWVFQQFVLWQSQLLRIRRDFHEHPELGFQTHRTAKRIADILLRFGVRHIDLKSVPGGVIAVIKRRRPVMFPDDKWEKMQPVIALRARIDASPATERNDIFYRSRNPGAAHTRGARRRNSLASRGRPGFRARHKAWKFDPRSDFRARF